MPTRWHSLPELEKEWRRSGWGWGWGSGGGGGGGGVGAHHVPAKGDAAASMGALEEGGASWDSEHGG